MFVVICSIRTHLTLHCFTIDIRHIIRTFPTLFNPLIPIRQLHRTIHTHSLILITSFLTHSPTNPTIIKLSYPTLHLTLSFIYHLPITTTRANFIIRTCLTAHTTKFTRTILCCVLSWETIGVACSIGLEVFVGGAFGALVVGGAIALGTFGGTSVADGVTGVEPAGARGGAFTFVEIRESRAGETGRRRGRGTGETG